MRRCAVNLTWWYWPDGTDDAEFCSLEYGKPVAWAAPCCEGCKQAMERGIRLKKDKRYEKTDEPG